MIAKRALDLFLSAISLVVLLPVIVAIGIWIKIDSDGPVFFRQIRIGRNGRPFNILKFRTMQVGAESRGPRVTAGDDSRITRSGLWLRRFKLDEFPQLWNVLAGEMSLVGPRPEVPEFIAFYPAEIRDKVLSVPPGLTDYAAIEFKDEAALLSSSNDPVKAYTQEILPIKIAHYVRYVDERSFLVDLGLIFRTIRAIASPDKK